MSALFARFLRREPSIPQQSDQTIIRRHKFIASLTTLLPASGIVLMGFAMDVPPDALLRFGVLSIATTSVAFCIGCCQQLSVRIRGIEALARDRFERGLPKDADLFSNVVEVENLRRSRYFGFTAMTVILWLFVAVTFLQYLKNEPTHENIAALCAGVNGFMAFWKIWDFTKMPPELEQSLGRSVQHLPLEIQTRLTAAEKENQ